jgi:uncharacterized membrane protein YjfL (UPF0719 family)
MDNFLTMLGLSMVSAAVNLIYSGVTILAVTATWLLADKYVLKGFDTMDEIRRGNWAVAVVAAGMILGLAVLMGPLMR